jgi:hypothetical protein
VPECAGSWVHGPVESTMLMAPYRREAREWSHVGLAAGLSEMGPSGRQVDFPRFFVGLDSPWDVEGNVWLPRAFEADLAHVGWFRVLEFPSLPSLPSLPCLPQAPLRSARLPRPSIRIRIRIRISSGVDGRPKQVWHYDSRWHVLGSRCPEPRTEAD